MPTIDQMRAGIVAEARSWQLTPYMHQGRGKGVGADCMMFILETFERRGHVPHQTLIDHDPGCGTEHGGLCLCVAGKNEILKYPPDWMMHHDHERILPIVEKWAHPVEHGADGDIVLYKFGRTISHGGILDGWPRILHAWRASRRVEYGQGDGGEIAFDKKGRPRIHGFYSVF